MNSNTYYPKTYTLSVQPYLDPYLKCYKNIVTINIKPEGPLGKYVHQTQFLPLSKFKVPGPCTPIKKCGLVISSIDFNGFGCAGCGDKNNLLTADQIPDLYSFLLSNGYKIDTSLTKMSNNSEVRFDDNKLLCFITYIQ